jgi:signal peptidase
MEENSECPTISTSAKKQKIKKIVITIILISTAIGAPFLIYWIMQLSLNTTSPMVVVVSGSMEPSYSQGDLLFLSGEDPNDIGFGDVIVFEARGRWINPPAEPVVHRVFNKTFYAGMWWFQTKGDANLLPDQWNFQPEGEFNPLKDPRWIPQTNIIGKVVGYIPFIGWIKILLTEHFLYPLLLILLCILIISLIYDYFIEKEKKDGTDKKDTQDKIGKELKEEKEEKRYFPT